MEIKFKHNRYYITGTPYQFDNRKTAEQLLNTLQDYERLKKKGVYINE